MQVTRICWLFLSDTWCDWNIPDWLNALLTTKNYLINEFMCSCSSLCSQEGWRSNLNLPCKSVNKTGFIRWCLHLHSIHTFLLNFCCVSGTVLNGRFTRGNKMFLSQRSVFPNIKNSSILTFSIKLTQTPQLNTTSCFHHITSHPHPHTWVLISCYLFHFLFLFFFTAFATF